MCSSFNGLDCASATTKGGGVGTASDVCRFCARTQLTYQRRGLSQLRQLEITNHNVTVASLQSVAQVLHGVSIDQGASCFTFGMDSIGDCASVLRALVANCINVTIGCANFVIIEALYPLFLIVSYKFRLYLHPLIEEFGTLVGIIGILPHPLVVEPSRLLVRNSSRLAADWHIHIYVLYIFYRLLMPYTAGLCLLLRGNLPRRGARGKIAHLLILLCCRQFFYSAQCILPCNNKIHPWYHSRVCTRSRQLLFEPLFFLQPLGRLALRLYNKRFCEFF